MQLLALAAAGQVVARVAAVQNRWNAEVRGVHVAGEPVIAEFHAAFAEGRDPHWQGR